MLTRRVIPCLDVSHGRVVKGVKFQGLRDIGDPVERSLLYQEQGADEIVVLDVSATIEARGNQKDVIRAIRKDLSIPLTVGGGIRCVADAGALLEAGADKVSVNTAAVKDPDLIRTLADQFGSQCVVLAIDARKHDKLGWEVLVRAGRDAQALSVIDWIRQGIGLGCGEILLTSWDRDGTGEGYDLDLLLAASKASSVPLIASGGAKNALHMAEGFNAGADAVLAASIFHDDEYTVGDVKAHLTKAGIAVRPIDRVA